MSFDRISRLPNDFLATVISSLNARELVQTCVLSRRWRNLWRSVPSVIFNHRDFLGDNDDDLESYETSITRFSNFVSNFLSRRDTAIYTNKFVFKCHFYVFNDPILVEELTEKAINYSIDHNTKDFHLQITTCNLSLQIPQRLFESRSLEEVYFYISDSNGSYKFVPDRVHLPNLRKIHFYRVSFDDENMNKFLSGSPNLKCLILQGCELDMDAIILNYVESFSLLNCTFLLPPMRYIPISISGPNIRILRIDGHIPYQLILTDMPANYVESVVLSHGISNEFSKVMSVLIGVVNMEICFDLHFVRMMRRAENLGAQFENLRFLTLSWSCILCWLKEICNFLIRCTNLEELVLCQTYCDRVHVSRF